MKTKETVTYGLITSRGVIAMEFNNMEILNKYKERQSKVNPDFIKHLQAIKITTTVKQEIINV